MLRPNWQRVGWKKCKQEEVWDVKDVEKKQKQKRKPIALKFSEHVFKKLSITFPKLQPFHELSNPMI